MALWTLRAAARLVKINPDTTPLTAPGDVALSSKAGEVLPVFVAHLENIKRG